MARHSRSAQLETRSARLKLPVRRKPYYAAVAPGIHLGYRRNKGAGTWTVKVANGHGGTWIKAFAVADDHEDADSGHVLTYWQGQDKARALARGNDPGERPVTVGEAVDAYAAELRSRRGHPGNVSRIRFHLTASLASKTVALLAERDLRDWRTGLLDKDLAPSTVKRITKIMKAVLTLAARGDQRITNSAAWRNGLASGNDDDSDTDVPRNQILSDDEVRTLVSAAYGVSTEYGMWIEAAAITGARASQLARLRVHDLQGDAAAPRVMMPPSRKGSRRRKSRKQPVPIPPAFAKALRQAVAGKPPAAPLLPAPRGTTSMRKYFARAVAAAGLDPALVPYALRHSSIVRGLLRGVPIRLIAVQHDTSTTMIEAHYSFAIADHADAVARRGLLDVTAPIDNVVLISGR